MTPSGHSAMAPSRIACSTSGYVMSAMVSLKIEYSCMGPSSGSEIGGAHALVGEQVGALQHDRSGLQHVRVVGQLQGLAGVLLDEQNRHALFAQLAERAEDRGHHQRGQAQRRLV